jgi:hypothetical protein
LLQTPFDFPDNSSIKDKILREKTGYPILCILFSVFFTLAFGQNTETERYLRNKINNALSAGDCDEAERKYNILKAYNDGRSNRDIELQIRECRRPPLRKATTAELTDIWNLKYGIAPKRRQNLIAAGIDPDDAQRRINTGEGKPPIPATNLCVSNENITFSESGGKILIDVTTDASDYQITNLPFWCKVGNKYANWFSLVCDVNTGTKRSDRVKIIAGGKEVNIIINQAGTDNQPKQETTLSVSKESIYFSAKGGKSEQIKIYSNSKIYSVSVVPWFSVQTNSDYIVVNCKANKSNTSRQNYFTVVAGDKTKQILVKQGSKSDYFNCPKTFDTWGLTLGYAPKSINNATMDCMLFGLKVEPLFKYGFGLNTGINLEGYSYDMFDNNLFNGFDYYAVNIPLHLEYRLNFSKWFNIFAYGGIGFTMTDAYLGKLNSRVLPEYGGGLRISHVQFNVGSELNLSDSGNNNQEPRKGLVFSISYMF